MAVCILRTVIQFSAVVKESFTYSHWEAASGKSKREKYLRIWNTLSLICTRAIQMHTHFRAFLKNFYKNLSFHLFPLGRAKLSGVFEKFFVLQKILSLIWTKGVEMHTHFWDFPRHIFYLPKISPHLFGITKPNDTLFRRKMRKYFSVAGALFCLLRKTPSLIPTGSSQMHTLNLKKFLSLHLFGIEKPKRTLFLQKFWKIFFSIESLDSACSKSPFTYSHWEEANSNPVSKNILLFAKPLHLFGIRRLKRNLFFRESRKIFLKKLFISKTSPHLFPLGEGIWG